MRSKFQRELQEAQAREVAMRQECKSLVCVCIVVVTEESTDRHTHTHTHTHTHARTHTAYTCNMHTDHRHNRPEGPEFRSALGFARMPLAPTRLSTPTYARAHTCTHMQTHAITRASLFRNGLVCTRPLPTAATTQAEAGLSIRKVGDERYQSVRACVRACMLACLRACLRACVFVCLRVGRGGKQVGSNTFVPTHVRA
jgi:hypothetical protein